MLTYIVICMQMPDLSGTVLEMLFKLWDSHGSLQCTGSHLISSRSVYIVRTSGWAHTQPLLLIVMLLNTCLSTFFFFVFMCVLNAEAGFVGLLGGSLPEELQQLFMSLSDVRPDAP